MTDIEPPHSAVPYLIAIVAAIVVNYALAWLFAKLHVAHALTGLKIALICWFGFLFVQYATISVFSAFETNPWPLILINMSRPFLAFAISGIVLGAWRRREL
jgi:fructose-specific phosphotransferase system IIC component